MSYQGVSGHPHFSPYPAEYVLGDVGQTKALIAKRLLPGMEKCTQPA